MIHRGLSFPFLPREESRMILFDNAGNFSHSLTRPAGLGGIASLEGSQSGLAIALPVLPRTLIAETYFSWFIAYANMFLGEPRDIDTW